jgi:hypothetical protein
MSNAFGQMPELVELAITSDSKFNTGAIKGKVKKRKDKDAKEEVDLPPFLADKMAEAEGDAAMVDIRDLRKFVRRMPNFSVLRWIGRGGRGEWRVAKSKKASTLIPIDFEHALVLTKQAWIDCQRKPPSFEFDDDMASPSAAKVLELPPSPDRHSPTDLPTLSRTTTGSSTSLTTAATPPSPIAIAGRASCGNSLSNGNSHGTSANSTVLGIEWESLPSPTSPNALWRAGPSRRLSYSDELEIRTKAYKDKEGKERRSSRRSRSPTKSTVRLEPNGLASLSVNGTPTRANGSAKKTASSSPSSPITPTSKPTCVASDGWTTVGDVRRA